MATDSLSRHLADRRTPWPHFNHYLVAYLSYLLFYPVPWLLGYHRPTLSGVMFSAAAMLLFLLVYFAPYRKDRYYGYGEIILTDLIGYACAWTRGDWQVYCIFAAGMCARLPGKRQSITMVILLQVVLIISGHFRHKTTLEVIPGAFFSIITYMGTLVQWQLGIRNFELREAQNEIRTLATTAERERIARDLHDLLGHSLTVISVKAELSERLFMADPPRARQEINEISQIARTSLREVREAVSGMNGASLLRELDRARRALHTAGITLILNDPKPSAEQPPNSVLALALREAVTNVIRHSEARTCTLTFGYDAKGQIHTFSLEDDGPIQTPRPGSALVEGNGLRGMRARLAASGGTLTISHRSQSFKLTATTLP
ncbi:sensor histidine kinase [Gluconobacter kanchanaburiensis]|uniref:Histidine kinase n=1 Tax=Gluconobacter kanchanaburiensis NBRC 103587 TaxID=1307948 RepID=A0A511BB02_9PROT|nr:sensor histidine kinase [Gluconobacter kanchanaburiensis]MBF0862667.1 sensor histidine kinase [Gluconobacter kanchanaburiensis]GBR67526.1 two component sensor histidine kinase [Gluconobacter kanchanaburiensis NBRC 103587]GEK96962.1 histidine kinase [Gluconobacter kanchanaburiensis NBRC 103587]